MGHESDFNQIAIPYSAILDVDKSSAMDFSETIEIKVLDKEASGLLSVDSYFFAYFHDLPSALDQIREAVRTHRAATEYDDGSPKTVLDTTVTRAPLNSYPERTVSVPTAAEVSRDKASGSGFRIASLLRPFGDSRPQIMPASESAPDVMEEFTHISKRSSASFVPVTTTGSPLKQLDSHTSEEDEDLNLTPKPANQEYHHTYPPSTSLTPSLVPDQTSLTRRESNTSSGSSWNVGVPSWLKGARTTRFFTSSVSSALPTTPPAPVKEVYSSTSSVSGSKLSSMGDMAFSVLDTPEMAIDGDVVDKFRTSFAYDEKEMLLGCTLHSTFSQL